MQALALGRGTLARAQPGRDLLPLRRDPEARAGGAADRLVRGDPCCWSPPPRRCWFCWALTARARSGSSAEASLLLLSLGPLTVLPLTAFSLAARRMPLSVLGFLQFIQPTILFVLGRVAGRAGDAAAAGLVRADLAGRGGVRRGHVARLVPCRAGERGLDQRLAPQQPGQVARRAAGLAHEEAAGGGEAVDQADAGAPRRRGPADRRWRTGG